MATPEIRSIGIRDVTFGEGVVIVEPVNLYGCEIGDGTFVGPFVEIQAGAVVGRPKQDALADWGCRELGRDPEVA